MGTTAGVFLLCLLLALITSLPISTVQCVELSSKDFPGGFLFGAGSSSYQSEGAWNEDGKGPSIWDTFTHKHPERNIHGNGDVADDFYHLFKEDVKLMKEIGLNAFRFSISWSRILPYGNLSGGVNPLGIKFYNNLIDELISNGIQPFVTLFHWDTPQALDDLYGSFLSPRIVNDFRDYAEVCFKAFGDRVKYWTTVNGPNIIAMTGYTIGIYPPGRCSSYVVNCFAGNSATEPYIVVHHMLLCHAAAADLYKHKYQATQKGMMGIGISTNWYVPIDQTLDSHNAAQRAKDFYFGWIVEPVTLGDYPEVMRSIVGSRLPGFTKAQSDMLKESIDFLGINYFSSSYAANNPSANMANLSYITDGRIISTKEKNGIPLGEPTDIDIFIMYPEGLRDIVLYLKDKYKNPTVIVTENGLGEGVKKSLSEHVNDAIRIKYISNHLAYLHEAIKLGGNVRGYFAWSFLDDYEWISGFTQKYGLVYVDFANGLKRTLKESAKWYTKFLAKSP